MLPSGWNDYLLGGFLLLFSFTAWSFWVVLQRRISRSGTIEFEIGQQRGGRLLAGIGAGGVLLAGVLSILAIVTDVTASASTQFRYVSMGIFALSLGICFLPYCMSTFSIRERGVIVHGQMIPWEKIEGFFWEKSSLSIMVLRFKRRLPFEQSAYVRIPPEKQKQLNEIMERHLQSLGNVAR
jgi:heme/copper-type cytochrome/quinol oxidase subunit 4